MKRISGLFALVMAAMSAAPLFADTHIIQCNRDETAIFIPKSFTAHVGDTLVWEGNFKQFALRSTTLPKGAEPWQVKAGDEFRYVLKVAGQYGYQNQRASAKPQEALFKVVPPETHTDWPDAPLQTLILENLAPDPAFKDGQVIRYRVTQPQEISLGLYNDSGACVAPMDKGFKAAGVYQASLPFNRLKPGFYTCRLEGNVVDIQTFHLERVTSDSLAPKKENQYHREK